MTSNLPIFSTPDRDRRSPIAVAADRPVARTFKPFAKAAMFDVLGGPMDLLVGRKQSVFDLLHSHKPGADGFVDQRGVGAPAERIAVVQRGMPG